MSSIKNQLSSIREKKKIKRSILNEINSINKDIKVLRDLDCYNPDEVYTKTSNINNPTQDKAIKIVDKYSARVAELLSELKEIDLEIYYIKEKLEVMVKAAELSENEYCVIKYYYFEGMSIEEVAMAMNYSEVWVKKVKSIAVNKYIDPVLY